METKHRSIAIWMILSVISVVSLWLVYPSLIHRIVAQIPGQCESCNANEQVSMGEELKSVRQDVVNDSVHMKGENNWESTGQYGDTYGGFNALFTALALCGIGFAAWLQFKQLKLQRLEIHAQHFPIIEWNAPIARFLGGVGTQTGGFAWGVVLMNTINNTSREAAANVIIKYSIVDGLDNELYNCACVVNGSVLGERNVFDCIGYACIEDQKIAVTIVDGLLGRNLRLKMEVHYMNLLGGAFVRKKEYVLDVPSSQGQAFLNHMKTRLQSGLKNEPEDGKFSRDFMKSLQEFIVSGKDTFVQEFAASISDNVRLICEPEDMAAYENFCKDCMCMADSNRPFFLGRYESSFGISRYRPKSL